MCIFAEDKFQAEGSARLRSLRQDGSCLACSRNSKVAIWLEHSEGGASGKRPDQNVRMTWLYTICSLW